MNKSQIIIVSFVLILLFVFTGGCSYLGMIPYPQTIQGQKQLLYGGKFEQATQNLAKETSRNNKVLYSMEQGMVHHIQGDYQASIEPFRQALTTIKSFEDRALISAGSLASIIGLVLGGVLYELIGPATFMVSGSLIVLVFLLSLRLGTPRLAVAAN